MPGFVCNSGCGNARIADLHVLEHLLHPRAERAMRKASSRDGKYFPASSAMMVCRVTPRHSRVS
jgi:hypothetical protein